MKTYCSVVEITLRMVESALRTDGTVFSLAVQPDGKIVVGGAFNALGGQPRQAVGRLNADGTLDTAFNPAWIGAVHSLVVLPDGKLLVGGSAGLYRLNADGTWEIAFNPGISAVVYSLALQADGNILVGGTVSTFNSEAIALVNANGTLD